MDRGASNTLIAAAALAACALAHAQSLGEPSPVSRVMGVAQFGMPRDAKLIFCEGRDCPDRTTKTLTSPTPVALPPAPAPVVVSQPMSIQPLAELSPAKVQPPKKLKKAGNKPRAPRRDCGSGTKK